MDSKICLLLGITMFMLCGETQAEIERCPEEDKDCNVCNLCNVCSDGF